MLPDLHFHATWTQFVIVEVVCVTLAIVGLIMYFRRFK